MAIKLNLNAVNQAAKGSLIFNEGEQASVICLILKGRVAAFHNGVKTVMGSGSFIGVSDIFYHRYISSYIAFDDIMLFAFTLKDVSDIEKILNVNKDYHGIMISYLNRYISELYKTRNMLEKQAKELFTFIKESITQYEDFCKKSGHEIIQIKNSSGIEPFTGETEVDLEKAAYYTECSKIPQEAQKMYFSYGNAVTMFQVKEQAQVLYQLNENCKEYAAYICELFDTLENRGTDSLFKCLSKLAIDIAGSGGRNEGILSLIDDTIEVINQTEKLMMERTGSKINVDRKKMEEIYFILISGAKQDSVSTDLKLQYGERDMETAKEELRGCAGQILSYSGLPQEQQDKMMQAVIDFTNLKDKSSSSDEARNIRRTIQMIFYDVYKAVFFRYYKEQPQNRIIEMFLEYGFFDENLLNQNQLMQLYFMEDNSEKKGPCDVYTLKDWFIEIYEGRKQPSKSEFDLTYEDNLREMKRTQNISAEEEKDYLTNPIRKVDYEIRNMFRCNHRVINGQISIFVPILHEDNFIGEINNMVVMAASVNECIVNLLQLDYSIFYREVVYYDEEKGIKKEYIMKQVFPDIILFPSVGSNSVMWQEITGKKRDTKGRFLLPLFAEGDLEEMLLKVFGRFRWELCRTIQGTAWNNIKERSLTSEYVDYIQFYKRNRDLSEERKEKLKIQIQKGKNNSREVFLIDYILWVRNESKGAMRLNKPARQILATYCPFPASIRNKLMNIPLFNEAMAVFIRENQKKLRELDLHIRSLEKDNIEIPEELKKTVEFYNI